MEHKTLADYKQLDTGAKREKGEVGKRGVHSATEPDGSKETGTSHWKGGEAGNRPGRQTRRLYLGLLQPNDS